MLQFGSQTFHCSILSAQAFRKMQKGPGREFSARVGVNDGEVPPVPIPNTVVKLIGAENTWMETSREDRSMPAPESGRLSQSGRLSFFLLLVVTRMGIEPMLPA